MKNDPWIPTLQVSISIAVADPRFPRRGALTQEGAPTYYLANFSRKLHENEEILGQRGKGDVSLAPP